MSSVTNMPKWVKPDKDQLKKIYVKFGLKYLHLID